MLFRSPILYGEDSELYKQNILASEKALLTIVHGKFLLNHFKNSTYLPHGVDTKKYISYNNNKEHKLLCVAKDIPVGRKGFHLAIEAAMKLNLPITIAGPNKNKEFFDAYPHFLKYEKLTILDNLLEDELIKVLNEHTIFLLPSSLETGVPNLDRKSVV